MHAWHGDVVALSGNAAVLKGVSCLAAGVDAARVRMRIIPPDRSESAITWETALATDVGDNSMSVIITSRDGIAIGDRLTCELDVRSVTLQPPVEKSRNLFRVDPATLSSDERRWLRQAVLFALEARDPSLRADRLRALGVA